MKKEFVSISNMGCDDSTEFKFEIKNEKELKIIKRFIEANNEASTYGCQPTIELI
jgi:hypothetical protein